MKVFNLTVIFLLLLILTVFINSFYINSVTDTISKELEAADGGLSSYEDIYENFKKQERYISLTVSHDDLTNIEEGFAELIGAVKVGDENRVLILKNRLKDSFEHLGRLSGINLDSIL